MADPAVRVRIHGKDELTQTLQKVRGSVSGLATGVKALFAGFAATQMVNFFKGALDKAIDAERRTNLLAGAIRNVGASYERVKPQADAAVKSMAKLTGRDKDDIAGGFGQLITLTGSYETALDHLQLMMDVAAFKHISLEQAADKVGKMLTGNTKAFKEFGISGTDVGSMLDQLSRKVDGFATDEGQRLEGRLGRIKNAWEDVLEALGTGIGEGLTDGSDGVVGALNGLTSWIEQNQDTISTASKLIIDAATKLIEFVALIPKADRWVTNQALEANAALSAIGLARPNASLIATLPGGRVDQFGDVVGGSSSSTERRETRQRQRTPAEIERARKAEERAQKEAFRLGDAGRVNLRLNAGFGDIDQDTAAAMVAERDQAREDARLENARARSGQGLDIKDGFELLPTEPVAGATAAVSELTEHLIDLKDVGLAGLEDGFLRAFAAAGSGAESFGEAVVDSVKGTISAIAMMEAKEQLAQGAKDLATGTWPPNPAAIAAAGKHFAAAALFAALGGAAGGGGGGGGGGGASSGGALGSSDLQRDRKDLAERADATIVLDYLNLDDPRREEQLARDLERLSGKRVRITRSMGRSR